MDGEIHSMTLRPINQFNLLLAAPSAVNNQSIIITDASISWQVALFSRRQQIAPGAAENGSDLQAAVTSSAADVQPGAESSACRDATAAAEELQDRKYWQRYCEIRPAENITVKQDQLRTSPWKMTNFVLSALPHTKDFWDLVLRREGVNPFDFEQCE